MIVAFVLSLGVSIAIIVTAGRKGDVTIGWILAALIMVLAIFISGLLGLVIGIVTETILLLLKTIDPQKSRVFKVVLIVLVSLVVLFAIMSFIGIMLYNGA
jgi:type IV secretory pathway TrbD component